VDECKPLPTTRADSVKGLPDIARHVIGCHLTEDTRAENALDDVAGNIRLA